jgi:hypothetical protein
VNKMGATWPFDCEKLHLEYESRIWRDNGRESARAVGLHKARKKTPCELIARPYTKVRIPHIICRNVQDNLLTEGQLWDT